VIDMALLGVIRRWALREGIPIRAISRRTGLSRNMIRKYLRSGAVEPRFKVPERSSGLDRFAERKPRSTAGGLHQNDTARTWCMLLM
jgi:transcriptional regulator with XRE-family HTH domain